MSDEYGAKKVVWILGSGFSKSLGGPLLPDLLSHRGEAYVKSKFPSLDRKLYELYRAHLKDDPESRGNPIYWDHAEEFLDFLTSASMEGGRDRYNILLDLIFQNVPRKGPLAPDSTDDMLGDWRKNAVKCIAAECLFTTHTSPRSEAWGPYKRWAKALGANDTIITFNYDMVLEKLGRHERDARFGPQSVIDPMHAEERSDKSEPDDAEREETKVVPVLKVHGSVGWFAYDHAFGRAHVDTEAATQLNGGAIPFIAAPGPDKMLQQEGTLRSLWERAKAALRELTWSSFSAIGFLPRIPRPGPHCSERSSRSRPRNTCVFTRSLALTPNTSTPSVFLG
jgi:hypothetical protein